MYTWKNPRPVYPNELYHYGVMGMHWGIRRYQPYRKGEKVKGGHFIGQAIAKNRTTRDSYLSSFLASDYQRKADKLHEETERRKTKFQKQFDKGSSININKTARKYNRWKNAEAREKDNQARADFWKGQAKADIATAKQVNDAFKKDHPNTFRKAPASSIASGANRWAREHVNPNTAQANVAPIWNWDRGWGHQWAAEKSQGFNYKQNRENRKLYKKSQTEDIKSQAAAEKSLGASQKGNVKKAEKYNSRMYEHDSNARRLGSQATEKRNNQMIKDGAKYAKARFKLDALRAKGITSGSRYEDALREEERWQKYLDRKYGTEHHLTSF